VTGSVRIVPPLRAERLVDISERVLMYGAPVGLAVASLQLGQRWNLVVLGLLVAAIARASKHDIVVLGPDGPSIKISYGYVRRTRSSSSMRSSTSAAPGTRSCSGVRACRHQGCPTPGGRDTASIA
jgi:hypothetical protein